MRHTRWFKDMVFYQIWSRSFRDGNGDGIGDLWGVLEKLDYLKELGIDGVWFSPLYPSPGADCGYDISDYMDIAPEYGGMEAFRAVLEGLHQRGMKLVMDLVVNHTSDEHEWFQKSRRRIEPYTDYYIWRPAKPNGKLPNNWDSHFEGRHGSGTICGRNIICICLPSSSRISTWTIRLSEQRSRRSSNSGSISASTASVKM